MNLDLLGQKRGAEEGGISYTDIWAVAVLKSEVQSEPGTAGSHSPLLISFDWTLLFMTPGYWQLLVSALL